MHAFLDQSADYFPLPVQAFGDQIRLRRLQLGLNTRRAASITGIERSDWHALEAGWVPRNERVLRALAGTLQVKLEALAGAVAPLEAHFAAATE